MKLREKLTNEDFLREAISIVTLLISLFAFVALTTYDPADLGSNAWPPNPMLSNLGGLLGAHLAITLYGTFGLSAYLLVGLLMIWSTICFFRKDVRDLGVRLLGVGMLVVATSILFSLRTDPATFRWADRTPSYGGLLGDAAVAWLLLRFGSAGVYMLVLATMAVSFLLATDLFFYSLMVDWFSRVRQWAPTLFPRRARVALATATAEPTGIGLGGTGVGLRIPSWLHHATTALEEPPQAARHDEATPPGRPHPSPGAAPRQDAPPTTPGRPAPSPAALSKLRTIVSERRQLASELARAEAEARRNYEQAAEEKRRREEAEQALRSAPAPELELEEPEAAPSPAPAATPVAREAKAAERPPRKRKRSRPPQPASKPETPAKAKTARREAAASSAPGSPDDEAPLPGLDLLDEPVTVDMRGTDVQLREKAAILIDTLRTFKIECELANIDRGPVITMFELSLAPGIKVQRVAGLADNIAMALKAPSVRIVAPIPGKSTVGVEVPNLDRIPVRLKEIAGSEAFRDDRLAIPMMLGKEATGKPLVTDLTRMPHLLIAGQTGAGKSVCINALLLSILMSRRPSEVKLLLVDPKQVELNFYSDVPHLLLPVVTDMKAAARILDWAVQEMEDRYEVLSKVGVRSLVSFNKLGHDKVTERLLEKGSTMEHAQRWSKRMPYIVIVIDELADLMMVAAKEVESQITRLAQKSRAVGIHLILATQRPSVDVITGLIKANIPCRISFQVACKIDSRTILDGPGAEKLLGRGDLLYRAPGTSFLSRAQGAYVDDAEVTRVVEHLQEEWSPPEFDEELSALAEGETSGGGEGIEFGQRDELYDRAVRIILETQRGSVSLLQRKLQIGYTRAAKLVDFMQEDGIVGPPNGSKAREIKMTLEEWDARKASVSALDDDFDDDEYEDEDDDDFDDEDDEDDDDFDDDDFDDDDFDDDDFEDDDDDFEDDDEDEDEGPEDV